MSYQIFSLTLDRESDAKSQPTWTHVGCLFAALYEKAFDSVKINAVFFLVNEGVEAQKLFDKMNSNCTTDIAFVSPPITIPFSKDVNYRATTSTACLDYHWLREYHQQQRQRSSLKLEISYWWHRVNNRCSAVSFNINRTKIKLMSSEHIPLVCWIVESNEIKDVKEYVCSGPMMNIYIYIYIYSLCSYYLGRNNGFR